MSRSSPCRYPCPPGSPSRGPTPGRGPTRATKLVSFTELSVQFRTRFGDPPPSARLLGAGGFSTMGIPCIMSISSCDRMWQWSTNSQPKLTTSLRSTPGSPARGDSPGRIEPLLRRRRGAERISDRLGRVYQPHAVGHVERQRRHDRPHRDDRCSPAGSPLLSPSSPARWGRVSRRRCPTRRGLSTARRTCGSVSGDVHPVVDVIFHIWVPSPAAGSCPGVTDVHKDIDRRRCQRVLDEVLARPKMSSALRARGSRSSARTRCRKPLPSRPGWPSAGTGWSGRCR